jgi:(p)ppGpp synthase/HD superfamily hydrolase
MLPSIPVAAKRFALKAHQGQMYGDRPYSTHLQDVWGVLAGYRIFGEALEAAAWLHDVVEDTEVSIGEISELFGQDVARLVGAVTIPAILGGRKVRLEALILQLTEVPDASPLKLADRIANVRASAASPRHQQMYVREYPRFREGIFPLSDIQDPRIMRMWWELDGRLLLPGGTGDSHGS